MLRPRYDEDKNESRHGAADRKDCQNMAERQKWRLKGVERIVGEQPIFKVDCVFEGKTEFPESFYEGEGND
jgi:hypothetical protein